MPRIPARLAPRNARVKRISPADDWPESWRYSYTYDLLEIYRDTSHRGYTHAYDNRRRQTLRLLTDVVPPGSRILDVAGAQGNFSLALAELGYRVTWNDLREDLAGYVQLKHERGEIEFAPGNALNLRFPEAFDAVLITEVIEHVAHPDVFLASIAGLVKPGGYLIVTTPNGAYFRNSLPKFSDCPDPGAFEAQQFGPDADGHIFLLHPEELALFSSRSGLQLEELVLFTNPLTNGHLKTEALLKMVPSSVVFGIEHMTSWLPRSFRRSLMVHMGARLRRPIAVTADANRVCT